MIPLRRILVAGLPAAGLTVAASLALAGSPAVAIEDYAARPAVMVTPSAGDDRGTTDYGTPAGNGNGTPAGGGTTGGGATPTGPTRGHGGYGGESPTPVPSTSKPTPVPSTTTPTAHVDTVPPGVQASETPAPAPSISGGVSAGHALPVTGAPMSAILTLGVLMVAGGAASVWYTRRRRSA
jgi:LPXTG-motif cell wall-anchored protein